MISETAATNTNSISPSSYNMTSSLQSELQNYHRSNPTPTVRQIKGLAEKLKLKPNEVIVV